MNTVTSVCGPYNYIVLVLVIGCYLVQFALTCTTSLGVTCKTPLNSTRYIETLVSAKAYASNVDVLNRTMLEYAKGIEFQWKLSSQELKIISLGETNTRNMLSFQNTLKKRQSLFHSLKETYCLHNISQKLWNDVKNQYAEELSDLEDSFSSPYISGQNLNSTSFVRKNQAKISRVLVGNFINERTFVCLGDSYGMFIDPSSRELKTFGYEYGTTVPLGRSGMIEPQAINLGLSDEEFIKQLICGNFHAMVLTNKRIIGWGENSDGRLGIPISSNTSFVTLPTTIKYHNNEFSYMNAGIGTAAIDNSGFVYTWGAGKYVIRKMDTDIRMQKVCLGEQAVGIGYDGNIYTWGFQSSLPSPMSQSSFPDWKDDVYVRDVQCGEKTTVALFSNGNVYSWGSYKPCLGGGDEPKSYPVPFSREFVGDVKFEKIGHRGSLVNAITSDKKVVSWGINTKKQCQCATGLLTGICPERFCVEYAPATTVNVILSAGKVYGSGGLTEASDSVTELLSGTCKVSEHPVFVGYTVNACEKPATCIKSVTEYVPCCKDITTPRFVKVENTPYDDLLDVQISSQSSLVVFSRDDLVGIMVGGYFTVNPFDPDFTGEKNYMAGVLSFPKNYYPIEERTVPIFEDEEKRVLILDRPIPFSGFDLIVSTKVRNNNSFYFSNPFPQASINPMLFAKSFFSTHQLTVDGITFYFGGVVNGTISDRIISKTSMSNVTIYDELLPYPVSNGVLKKIDEYIYIFGGMINKQVPTPRIMRARLSNLLLWEVMEQTLPKSVYNPFIQVIEKSIYFLGGRVNRVSSELDIHVASVLDLKWSNMYTLLPYARVEARITSDNGNYYIWGGKDYRGNSTHVLGSFKNDPTSWVVTDLTLPIIGSAFQSVITAAANSTSFFLTTVEGLHTHISSIVIKK